MVSKAYKIRSWSWHLSRLSRISNFWWITSLPSWTLCKYQPHCVWTVRNELRQKPVQNAGTIFAQQWFLDTIHMRKTSATMSSSSEQGQTMLTLTELIENSMLHSRRWSPILYNFTYFRKHLVSTSTYRSRLPVIVFHIIQRSRIVYLSHGHLRRPQSALFLPKTKILLNQLKLKVGNWNPYFNALVAVLNNQRLMKE